MNCTTNMKWKNYPHRLGRSLQDDVDLRDVVIAVGACTDSNYAAQYNLPGTFAPIADYELLESAAYRAFLR